MRRATALGLALAGALLGGLPAHAHPFGDPPTAVLRAEGREVEVVWRADLHDAIALAAALGLIDQTRIDWQWSGPTGIDAAVTADGPLEQAPALHRYVLEHIVVLQDGAACDAAVRPSGDFLTNGTRVLHRCPADVEVVTVRLTMLHDLDEAYRTAAEAHGDASPRTRTFTVSEPEHRWRLGDAAAATMRPAEWWPPVAGLLLAAVALTAATRQRRRRLLA